MSAGRNQGGLATRGRVYWAAALLRSPRTPEVLGDDHPVSRSANLVHIVAAQAAATSSTLALGSVALADGRSWGIRLLTAGAVVELALLAILALAYQLHQEHVLRFIASGGDCLALDEISRQVERLARPAFGSDLARQLERALNDSRRWSQIPPACRPPEGLRALQGFAPEVRAIVAHLRTEAAVVAGLALLTLMLCNAEESALYAGDRTALQEQLGHVSDLLGVPRRAVGADGSRPEEEPW